MPEPVTLEMARAQCRISETDTDHDADLAIYIAAARDYVETNTRHIVMRREITEAFDGFACNLELTFRPVVSVEGVAYVDAAGGDQSFADFTAGLGRNPVRIYRNDGASWPAARPNSSVVVTYTAGYDDPATEAPGLIQAMLLLIGHWFANRSAVGTVTNEIAFAVDALCGQRRPVF
jgi:uncharacterized phiE125 gp8 family phage protein